MIILFYLIVGFHFFIIFTNLVSIPFLLLKLSWFISIPISTLIVNLMFSPIPCPLTKMEQKIRIKLNMKPLSTGFVGYYIIIPVKKMIRYIRNCNIHSWLKDQIYAWKNVRYNK